MFFFSVSPQERCTGTVELLLSKYGRRSGSVQHVVAMAMSRSSLPLHKRVCCEACSYGQPSAAIPLGSLAACMLRPYPLYYFQSLVDHGGVTRVEPFLTSAEIGSRCHGAPCWLGRAFCWAAQQPVALSAQCSLLFEVSGVFGQTWRPSSPTTLTINDLSYFLSWTSCYESFSQLRKVFYPLVLMKDIFLRRRATDKHLITFSVDTFIEINK